MSVSYKELLHGHIITDLSIAQQQNLQELQKRLNNCQKMLCNVNGGTYLPFAVTSGFRTTEDQQRINPAAMGSNHLTGKAADIRDVNGTIKSLLKDNPDILEMCELWCEDASATPGWCHFQTIAPKSGKRWFLP